MSQKKKIIAICSVLLVLVICVSCLSYAGFRMIRHEHNQDQLISRQQKEIAYLKDEVQFLKNLGVVKWTDEGFNYLAIGNSITKHGITDFWWNEIGMAATAKEKDFVHLIASAIEMRQKVNVHAFNFYIWEVQAHDRAESLKLLDKYLDKRLNLITIQLGENVEDLTSFKKDFAELIHYVRGKAPKAQLMVIDDFWDKGKKSAIKKQVAQIEGVQFIDLVAIKDDTAYQCGLGTVVFDKNGLAHVVEHEGVAKHPGNQGMEYIAKTVLQVLN